MNFLLFEKPDTQEVIKLFTRGFAATEREGEGKFIANLVSNLISETKPSDLFCYVAKDYGAVVGCIFFSRFIVPSPQIALILSPVAIDTESQGKKIGQRLIRYGIEN